MDQIPRYRHSYPGWPAFLDDYESNLKFGGCQLHTTPPPPMFSQVEILLEPPEGQPVLLRGQVVMEAVGQGFMVQIEGGSLATQQALEGLVETARQRQSTLSPSPKTSAGDQADSSDRSRPTTELMEEAPDRAEAPAGRLPDSLVRMPTEDLTAPEGTLFERIRSLGVGEKKRLALSGDREQRMILAREPLAVIHPFLLKNPRITLDEVLFLARNGQTNPEALELIAENKRWISDSRIVQAMVLNPKSPLQLTVRLLDRLPPQELRRIAKRTDLKQALLQAARRRVLETK
ncbi:MAG: hypothetical protein JW797_18280 [Bradymonadales bacterium]|nr:hypothetical protein [Bradymonadales bacterium]